MQVTAVIIDDEQPKIDDLAFLLKENCPQVTIIATAKNVDEGRKIILQHDPNIVFLDIMMPDKTGFDLLKTLSTYSFEVIFVTGFGQYGIQAVKSAAIDYLMKPVDPEELIHAVGKAIQKIGEKKHIQQLANLIQLLRQQQNREVHRIALTTLKGTRFVYIREIVHCRSEDNYTKFFLLDAEPFLVSKPIFEYEEMLKDYGFVRCHQSHLVNKRFISGLLKGDGDYILLGNGAHVPVSRQKREMIKQELTDIGRPAF